MFSFLVVYCNIVIIAITFYISFSLYINVYIYIDRVYSYLDSQVPYYFMLPWQNHTMFLNKCGYYAGVKKM